MRSTVRGRRFRFHVREGCEKLEAAGEKRIAPYLPREPRGDSRGITRLSHRQVFFFFAPPRCIRSGRVRSGLIDSINEPDR